MNLKEEAKLLSVLADENRLKIVTILMRTNQLCANDLLAMVEVVQSTLSHHLSVLVSSNILRAKKQGTFVYYSLNKSTLSSLLAFLSNEATTHKEIDIREEKPAPIKPKKEKEKDTASNDEEMPSFLL